MHSRHDWNRTRYAWMDTGEDNMKGKRRQDRVYYVSEPEPYMCKSVVRYCKVLGEKSDNDTFCSNRYHKWRLYKTKRGFALMFSETNGPMFSPHPENIEKLRRHYYYLEKCGCLNRIIEIIARYLDNYTIARYALSGGREERR